MRTAPVSAGVAKAVAQTALWFWACNLLAAVLAAQCSNPTPAPNQTYSPARGTSGATTRWRPAT